MRQSKFAVAIAAITVLTVPAHAAKYTCTFEQNGNPVGPQCTIDPTTTNTSCQQSMGGNLMAGCAAGRTDDDKVEALFCVFGVPANVAEAMKNSVGTDRVATFRALAAKPGFFAQNFSVFSTPTPPLITALAYRENQASPVLTAACQ